MMNIDDSKFYILLMKRSHLILMNILEKKTEVTTEEVIKAIEKIKMIQEITVDFKIQIDDSNTHTTPEIFNDTYKYIAGCEQTLKRLYL